MPPPKGAVAEVIVEPRVANRFTLLCYAAVLLSAILLFEVELVIGKFLLPWFGGVPAVWITCLLFFQLVLLAGYSYAHKLAAQRPLVQAAVHASLLGISLTLLMATAFFWRTPITPGPSWKPYVINHPTWQVLRLLAASVGIPFLLLSATAPLLQSWFAKLRPEKSPYPLYALSNFGSLLALLAYPLLVEPNSTLRMQGWVWSAGYLLFALLCAGCAASILGFAPVSVTSVKKSAKEISIATPLLTKILWAALAACASAMLLAVTNMICQEVAVVPLLWVLPLAVYLITFIACFARRTIYRRWWVHPLFAMGAMLAIFANHRSVLWEIGAYLIVLFATCMACHGELVRLKPDASQSTSFYFWISCGGALGSVFVSLIAPQVFVGLWELPIALLASEAVILVALFRDRQSWLYESPAWLPVALVWGFLLYFRGIAELFMVDTHFSLYSYVMMAALSLVSIILLRRHQGMAHVGWFRPVQFFVVAAIGMLTFYSTAQMRSLSRDAIYESRNFFGVLRVSQDSQRITLKHGRTFHGMQLLDPDHRDAPTSYYLPQSGIGILLQNYPGRARGPMRVGVVGLGVGTLATYGRPSDYYRFYDINPAVYQLSKGSHPYFTFLADSHANVEVELGDARLLMEVEAARGELQNFDVLVLDAFNSDAIPVHLLTQEAVELYLRHLKPNGVLAVHISNRSINLAPVLAGIARKFDLVGAEVDFTVQHMQASRWVLLAKNGDMLNLPGVRKWAGYGEPFDRAELWTDDYSNLLHLMVWR